MGNYTIRTNDDEDHAIRGAQECIGAASVSKAFMTTILEHQHNKDEIARLRQALAQEQARNMELAASVKKFRTSLNSMFALADTNLL